MRLGFNIHGLKTVDTANQGLSIASRVAIKKVSVVLQHA